MILRLLSGMFFFHVIILVVGLSLHFLRVGSGAGTRQCLGFTKAEMHRICPKHCVIWLRPTAVFLHWDSSFIIFANLRKTWHMTRGCDECSFFLGWMCSTYNMFSLERSDFQLFWSSHPQVELPPLAVLAAALEKMEKTAVLPTPDESTGSRIQVSFQGWKCLWMEILPAGPVCPAAQMPFRVTVMQFSIMDCDTELLTHGLHSKFHCFTGKKNMASKIMNCWCSHPISQPGRTTRRRTTDAKFPRWNKWSDLAATSTHGYWPRRCALGAGPAMGVVDSLLSLSDQEVIVLWRSLFDIQGACHMRYLTQGWKA